MNSESQNKNQSDFKDYLIKNRYSKHVIIVYIRKIKEFLKYNENVYLIPETDYEELKKTISAYLTNIPLTLQKGAVQAALHTYYSFISGKTVF